MSMMMTMCKKLSKEHKAVILKQIEEGVSTLEKHMDGILDVRVGEQCRTAKTGKTAQKKK